MDTVNVHASWDPLEEIWLGDVWPKEFYEDLDPEVRKAFNLVTDWTKEDLAIIEDKLKTFGVTVRRPAIDVNNRDKYIDPASKLLEKPPICLRDCNAVIGNTLFFQDNKFSNLISYYDDKCVYKPDIALPISGAGLVKIGRDILFDNMAVEMLPKDSFFYNFYYFEQNIIKNFSKDYRIYYATNGGHCDSAFMPLKFGVFLSTLYSTGYDFFLRDWNSVDLVSPTYYHHIRHGNPHIHWTAPKWYLPDSATCPGPKFTEYLEKFCQTWIGEYTETFFEVNVVSIDEENIMCIGDEKNVYPYIKEIEKYGIKCHLVPFRTRTFWDGGIHCITLDTKRKGTLRDFYPDRGEMGFKGLTSKLYKSTDQFMDEYLTWKEKKNL